MPIAHTRTHARTHTTYHKLGVVGGGVSEPMETVVGVGGLGQTEVLLPDLQAAPQSHVTHQDQPGAAGLAGLGVLQTGAVGAPHEMHTGTLQRY